MSGYIFNPAQGDVTTQNRSIDPVYGYFTSNPQAPQLAPEAAREGHHQGLEPTNHPNVSWQQQRIQVISFTQESPRGARFHNNGRPFRPRTQGSCCFHFFTKLCVDLIDCRIF